MSFGKDILTYVREEEEIEKILALTIRDIFLNDLIYIRYNTKWMQYDMKNKQWTDFDVRQLLTKLDKLDHYYKHDLLSVMKQSHQEDKEMLVKKVTKLSDYIKKDLDIQLFLDNCSKYFQVGE